MLSNTCSRITNPETKRRCEGQMEFFGISEKAVRLPGWPKAIKVHFRWQQCAACGEYREETFTGQVISQLSKMTDKQIDSLFPSEERKNDRNRKSGKSKQTKPRLSSSPSA